jgi:hypothetical protein
VTLDTIVGAFDNGATADEIAQQYPSVPLADVYSVITYYLRHKADVRAYLGTREEQADLVRSEVETRSPGGPSGPMTALTYTLQSSTALSTVALAKPRRCAWASERNGRDVVASGCKTRS